ncbi:MAG: acetylornithine deacetylase [Alphaproteobacteria bacterium]|nr:acetylornithine deacetylase [Alphaproteobacteria bacterium]
MPTLRDDLATLIAAPTVSSAPVTPAAAHLATRLEDAGLRIERFEADEPGKVTLVATAGPAGTDGLLLTGHMDVVPVEGQPWTCEPFRLTEREGRWLGRGTADMKGFLAACLQAVDALPLARLQRELVLVLTHDEEIGCLGAGHLVEAWDPARTLPTACWVGEPTDFRVMRMHAGHVAVHVEVEGRAAHTSRPALGDNAIERAARVIEVVRELAADLRTRVASDLPMDDPTVPLVVARVQGGTAVNVVPDRCTLQLGYRPLPGMPPEAVFDELRERLAHRLGYDAARVHLSLGTVTPALLTPAHGALQQLLQPHAQPGPEVAPFATDGGQLARLGTAPVVFGPGSIDVAHQADEHVAIDALERTVRLLGQVAHARCVAP